MKKCLLTVLSFFIALNLSAKTVKLGYYIDSGNFMSGFSEEDPKGGYAYEYMQTVASYIGWEYEYVYGYWDTLYAKLLSGEIDILTDISYSKDRLSELLYPSQPMGTESYYLYARDLKSAARFNSLEDINGKKLAVSKDAFQYHTLMEWLRQNNLSPIIYEFNYSDDITEEFKDGTYDLYLDIDTVAEQGWEPIAKIGESNFFAVVTKSRPDILNELNSALDAIYITNPYFNNNLWTKYFSGPPLTKRLFSAETEWLKNRNSIRIGCMDGDTPYSWFNGYTQQPDGIVVYLMNYLLLDLLAKGPEVTYTFYKSYEELEEAVLTDTVDAGFPFNSDWNTAEKKHLYLSSPVLNSNVGYVFNPAKTDSFMKKLAVIDGRRSEMYAKTYFADSEIVEFATPEKCLDAVLKGTVSGAIFNIPKIQEILYGRKKYKALNFIELPDTESLHFVVSAQNTGFLSIMNKQIASIPQHEIQSNLNQYSLSTLDYSFQDFINDYARLLIVCAIIFAILVITLITSLDIIAALINYDALTHLLNRRRLTPYMKSALEYARESGEPFSILMFDLDNFKQVNDTFGHDCGDEVLKMAASTILKGVKRNDHVFRWGGEEILVILKGDNEVAKKVAERIRADIARQEVQHGKDTVHITASIGIATYNGGDTSESMFSRADENLYIAKNNGKNQSVG
mgnify:CR=1 FL=1